MKSEEKTIVYLDESGFAHDMPRTHGYAMKWTLLLWKKHDWGAKERTNTIGALLASTIIAIGLLTGSVNTRVFTCWVDKILLPHLPNNSTVVMDNATFHKGMQKLIKKKWAQVKPIRRTTDCTIDEIFSVHLS